MVAVGGTTLNISGNTYVSETAWSDSGGGLSHYESRPSYQNSVSSVVGSSRGTPDVSFDANPSTGVEIYDSYDAPAFNNDPWIQIGGTSLGAPAWAGLIAIADQGRVASGLGTLSSTQTLTALYSTSSSDFHDITSGSNGSYSAQTGYDLVTGIGSPLANLLIPALADSSGSGSGGTGTGGSGGSGTGGGTGTGGGGTGTGGGGSGGGGIGSGLSDALVAVEDDQQAYVAAYDAYMTRSGSYAAYYYAYYAYYYSYYAYEFEAMGQTAMGAEYAYEAYLYGSYATQYAYNDYLHTGSTFSYEAYTYGTAGSQYSYLTSQAG